MASRLPANIRMGLPHLLAIGAVCFGLSLGCGGGGTTSTPVGGGITGQVINVGQAGNFFNPSSLTVKAGTSVTFVWLSGGHSMSSGANCVADGKFGNTNQMTAGQTLPVPLSVTNTPGTYPYFCNQHCGLSMTGTLIVTP